MPIGGNNMHSPGRLTPDSVNKPTGLVPNDPITAAVTAAVAKVQPQPRVSEPPPTSEVVLDPDAPRDDLERQLLALRDPPAPVEVVPPKPTARQRQNTELEMQAGRKRVEHFKALDKNREQPKPDPREGSTIPVMRSGDYQHEKGNQSKGLK